MSRKYIVIFQQVVGNPEYGYGVSYTSDMRPFTYREDAIRHGLRARGSDDFNIGALDDGKLSGFYWMDERHDDDLSEIAKHLAIEAAQPAGAPDAG